MHPCTSPRALLAALALLGSTLAGTAAATAPDGPAAQAAAAQTAAPPPAPVPGPKDPTSYTIGQIFGSQLLQAGFDQQINMEALTQGITAGMGGHAPSTEDRARIAAVMRADRQQLADRNRARAHAFLAKNAREPGVTTTSSGLQYQVVAAGDAQAAPAGPNDRVTVRYRGRLLDGSQFDSSEQHGQAATFTPSGVIRGWQEAFTLMKPGASWRLFIPPELAYDANPPPAIPPGSLLIFDVELLHVERAAAPGSASK